MNKRVLKLKNQNKKLKRKIKVLKNEQKMYSCFNEEYLRLSRKVSELTFENESLKERKISSKIKNLFRGKK